MVILFILSGSFNLRAQQSILSARINELSRYITGFRDSGKEETDIFLMDSIFTRAVAICGQDTSEALLTATFAVLPYNKVPIRLKIFGLDFSIPVFSADESTFYLKNSKLPHHLYVDMPKYRDADKDKPAHFFGSAFLSYSLKIDYVCNGIGKFVEVFEEAFTPDNQVDVRDLLTNTLGRRFGSLLRGGKPVRPSDIFIEYNFSYFFRHL